LNSTRVTLFCDVQVWRYNARKIRKRTHKKPLKQRPDSMSMRKWTLH
jgi:hypothetical protein